MLHTRTWHISEIECVDQAVSVLTENQNESFGLRIGNLLFLNDSTNTGIKEYAVIDENREIQIDSWSIGWMSQNELKGDIEELLCDHPTYEEFKSFNRFDRSMVTSISMS